MAKSIVFIDFFFFSGWILMVFLASCMIALAVCLYYVAGKLLTI